MGFLDITIQTTENTLTYNIPKTKNRYNKTQYIMPPHATQNIGN
jgi:hypothetical protein